ncbi:MAG: DUF4416 family protein [Sphaerochaeta sp.]|uniref:DUF4416 family protein n=1 Tax=Sphaerochaeta sp. TaxID=1972642 RepID=UPI002FCA6A76
MGSQRAFLPCRLVMGLLIQHASILPSIFDELQKLFGPVLEQSELCPFTFTNYYDEEMGAKPLRLYLSFAKLVDPSSLALLKHQTNHLEDRYRFQGRRTINLDPGLLSLSNLILATTKGRAHRIPLSDGIYAELTLLFAQQEFQILPWTYADYQSETVRSLFFRWRQTYHQQLKREGYLLP